MRRTLVWLVVSAPMASLKYVEYNKNSTSSQLT